MLVGVPHPVPTVRRRARPLVAGAVVAATVAVAATLGVGPALGQVSTTTYRTSTTRASSSVKPSSTYVTSTTAYTTTTTYATTTTTVPPTTEPATTEAPAPPLGAGAAPFPAGTVATVPPADVEADRALAAVYVTAGGDAKSAPFAVQFRKPFELPKRPYRLSIVFGDPLGPQVRASLSTNGGPTPTGKVEKRTGDGADWTFIATTDVAFDTSGLASITYPVEIAPKGAAWAEVQVGEDGDITQSPYWSPDALVGKAVSGRLTSAPVGQVIGGDGKVAGNPVGLPGPPQLTVVNQAVELSFPAPRPESLAGHAVTGTVASVQVAPSYTSNAALSDEIRVDRTTGTINLIDRMVQPPADKTSEEGWLVQGLPADDPGAPATVTFDLAKVLSGLGLDESSIDQVNGVGLGVRQEYVLDDGTTVVGAPVLATTEWFALNADVAASAATAPEAAPQGPLVADEADDGRTRALVIAAVVLAVVLLGVLALLVRRRLARREDAADVLETLAHEAEAARTGRVAVVHVGADGTPEVAAPEVVEPEPPAWAVGAPTGGEDAGAETGVAAPLAIVTVEDLQRGEGEGSASTGGAGSEPQVPIGAPTVAPASSGEPSTSSGEASAPAPVEGATRRDPGGALAALDAEMADLAARLSRLSGGSPPPAPREDAAGD